VVFAFRGFFMCPHINSINRRMPVVKTIREKAMGNLRIQIPKMFGPFVY
jgi:hypothetical protein